MSSNTPSGFAPLMALEESHRSRVTGLQADLHYWRTRAEVAEDGLHRLAAEIGAQPPLPLGDDQPATVPVPLDDAVALSQGPGAPVAPTITGRLEPLPQPYTLNRLMRAASVVFLATAFVLTCTGCGGGDASEEEVAQHDAQQTIQPVACAASGCAR